MTGLTVLLEYFTISSQNALLTVLTKYQISKPIIQIYETFTCHKVISCLNQRQQACDKNL